MNSQPVATTKVTALAEVCNGIVTMRPHFEEALRGSGVSVDRFIQVAKQGLQTHKDVRKLLEADRKSLYLSIQKAASDGLMLDGRDAALVVFGTEVVFMPMVQGLVKLARNSGEISGIGCAVVYKNDTFEYIEGMGDAPKHTAEWFSEDRGEPVGAWAYVRLKNGDVLPPAILPKSKIMRVAAKSKNGYQYDCKKGDAWEEWWKKTAVKNVLKYAPRSTALDKALDHDNEINPIDVTPEPEAAAHQAVEEKPKRKSRLDKVKDAAAAPDTPIQSSQTIEHAPQEAVRETGSQEMPEMPEFLKRDNSEDII